MAMKNTFSSPARRVILTSTAAFIVYGSWALFINFSYGLSIALWACFAQGISSTLSTLLITTLIELFFTQFGHSKIALLLSGLLPPTLTTFIHAAMQWIVRTPDITITILPSVVMGYIFSALYLRALIYLEEE